jgi:hypothetical protein
MLMERRGSYAKRVGNVFTGCVTRPLEKACVIGGFQRCSLTVGEIGDEPLKRLLILIRSSDLAAAE